MRINIEKSESNTFNKKMSIWHTWFAWYPVKVRHTLVWLEKIERRIETWDYYVGIHFAGGGWTTHYRFIGDTND